ncbi:MAG: TonB-dependent receptor plug [Betaproteobacteria bacterium]|nr:TonB-dependent receptor plug [Betaproteobacteria bacterium]
MQSFLRFTYRQFTLRVAITAVTTLPAYAQLKPATTLGDEVVVTATRFKEPQQAIPIGVTVITAEQIHDSTASFVPELLMQFPGIHVRDNSGSPNQQVDMRGFGIFGDQNTLVLLDGQRISENEQSSVNWAAIPLSSIERIEIMRGSGAVLYGGGATGGTINIITKTAEKRRKSAFFGAGVATYNTSDARAGFSVANDRVGLIVNGNHLATDNYRANNQLRQDDAQADLRYSGERGTLYAKFGADDQQLQLPGSLSQTQIARNPRLAATPGDFSHISGGYGNLGGEYKLGEAQLALNASYRGKQANSAFFVATPFRNNISTHVNVASVNPRAKIPFTIGGLNNTLVAGADWDSWDYDQTASAFFSHSVATQRDTAYYVQDTLALGEATILSAGGRAQSTTYNLAEIIGGNAATQNRDLRAYEIAARHKLNDAWGVYGKFGTSFRLANINDNFNLFSGAIALLEPQTSHDREIGAELKLGRGSYRLALYHMDINHEIHLDPIAFNNVNLPPTRRYGAELEGKWIVSPALNLFANYTYTVAKFRSGNFGGIDVTDKDVPLVPHGMANAGMSWEFLPRTRVNAVANYVGQQRFDSDDTNTFNQKMPSYTLLDLKLSHAYRGWLLNTGVKNLFNQKYFTYGVFTGFPTFNAYPAAERSVFVSAQYEFK